MLWNKFANDLRGSENFDRQNEGNSNYNKLKGNLIENQTNEAGGHPPCNELRLFRPSGP
jgi:hypothetical protein